MVSSVSEDRGGTEENIKHEVKKKGGRKSNRLAESLRAAGPRIYMTSLGVWKYL